MRKICLIFAALSASLLQGCSTTNDAMTRMSYYFDRSADDFFRNNGMPTQAYKFENGDKVYRWTSAARSVHMPAFTTFSGNVDSLGQAYGAAQTVGGYTASLSCVIDIHTNSQNKITRMVPVVDTWGAWETSRCNETLR